MSYHVQIEVIVAKILQQEIKYKTIYLGGDLEPDLVVLKKLHELKVDIK